MNHKDNKFYYCYYSCRNRLSRLISLHLADYLIYIYLDFYDKH